LITAAQRNCGLISLSKGITNAIKKIVESQKLDHYCSQEITKATVVSNSSIVAII
jgi:hypothetical protein